jgi:phosphoglycolate phosphatase-like HAD superfamily hydrolase
MSAISSLDADHLPVIFQDLDGPILECKNRYYACYLDVCRERGLRAMSRDEYWALKRERIDAATIFARSGARGDESALLQSWIELVERPQYLALDTVYPGALDVLSSWAASGARLRLVTLRRDSAAVHAQLERLGLLRFFERVFVCDPARGGEGKAAAAMRDATAADARQSVWVGDTEVDAIAAATVGSQLFLVTCGIRSEAYLRSLGAGEVVSDLRAVRDRLTV